jgi:hypothetical protein
MLIQHLASAWKAVAELQQLGCNVLRIDVDKWADAPNILIADPGALLDHIDGMSVDCSAVEYVKQGVRVAGCNVVWYLVTDTEATAPGTADAMTAAADSPREALS